MDPRHEEALPDAAAPSAGNFVSDAFLSYASADAEVAKEVCASLEAAGLRIWMAPRDVPAGAQYADALVRAINASRSLLLILSEHSVDSAHVSKEVERASSKRKPIVAIRIDAAQLTPAFEYFLSESQWVEARDGLAAALPRLTEDLRKLIASTPGNARTRVEQPVAASAAGARSRATPVVALSIIAGLLIAGGSAWWLGKSRGWWTQSAGNSAASGVTENSVAVLPFTDLSEKKDQQYFSDGLSVELIDLLGKIPSLRVPARTSSFYFRDKPATLADIGKLLKVSHVLEGTVQKSGTALRVSAELVNVADDSRMWSETYNRTLSDVFQVQDDIANSVVSALKVTMLGAAEARAAPTTNSEAHLAYLRGIGWGTSSTDISFDEAVAELRKAVSLDPNFAQAWSALAGVLVGGFVGDGQGTYETVRREAIEDLHRSLEINPDSALEHAQLAEIFYQMDWTPEPAHAELARALAINPKEGLAIWLKGYIANSEGHFDEAIAMHNQSRDLDPLQADNYRQLGNAYYRSGRFDEGIAILKDCKKRIPFTPTVHYRLGLILLAQNKPEEALSEFKLEEQRDFQLLGPPLALDRLGRRQESDKMLADAMARETVTNGAAYQLALIYANRGDADHAFEWLERGFKQRDAGMLWMKFDPLLRPLSNDPRFKAILEKMHQS